MSNSPEQFTRSRSHSRSRDREDYERVARLTGRRDEDQQQSQDEEVFNIYVTNLSYETNSDALRAAFERIGPVQEAQVVIEPTQRVSRGFGFVSMTNAEDSQRALELHGTQLDGRSIRVEKARRKSAYEKTPGQYMGPSNLSAKYGSRRRDDDDRPPRRDVRDYDHRDRDRERDRERDYDRDRLRGPPGPAYEPRYREERFRDYRDDPYARYPPRDLDYAMRRGVPPANYDPRDVRSGPPPGYPPYDRRSRSPPRDYRHRSPPRDFRPSRSPPRMLDDRRFPVDRQGPPPSYRGPLRY